MAYDPAKDEKLHVSPEIEGDRDTSILVGIFSYNGDVPKARVNRSVKRQSGEVRIGKVGGMSRQETRLVGKTLAALAEDDRFWVK